MDTSGKRWPARPCECDRPWQKVRAGGYEGWVNRKYLSGE
ncbi:MAG: hypothetical protein EOP02_07340 [Proteobacteria bacterium]|nr:MAG: hypothetical protein EOP02_07340 [Pseudomonadota bacterium]